MIYGNFPKDLGLIDLSPTEMMFWMYCPIKAKGDASFRIPENLKQFTPIINKILSTPDALGMVDKWVYITAKTLWVSGDYIGNRPGWHSDGFGSNDINYIWSDRAPTEFAIGDWEFSDDHNESLLQMEEAAKDAYITTYEDKHLLRLDPSVIHRSPVNFEPGMRSFVKISISDNEYNLEGNSVNHLMPQKIQLHPRAVERNHPTKEI